MGDNVKSPLKLQVFPQQRIKDLPKDQDIEFTIVPKQVIQFQGISSDDSQPKLTVTVNATGRSELHYTPSDCVSGTQTCFETPGMHEMWVPQTQGPHAKVTITGFSAPQDFRIPKSIFDPGKPLQLLIAEAPGNPLRADFPSKDGSFSAGYVPDGLDDFYIAMPDNTRALEGSFLQEGGHAFSDLSDGQKKVLLSLINEVVAAGGVLLDERELLNDFGLGGKFYLKKQEGKTYIVFKGYAGLRRLFRGTRYALDKNYARFSMLTVGAGPLQAAKAGLPNVKAKGTMVGFLFMGAVNAWTWIAQDAGERFISDLILEIGSGLVKSVVGGVAAAFVMGAVTLLAGPVLPVYVVIVGAVAIGMIIGLGLDFIDEKIGVTDSIKKVGRKTETGIKSAWSQYIEEPAAEFLMRCDWEIRRIYGVH